MRTATVPASAALQLTALFLVAFNLRVAMACIGPVQDYLRTDLDMSRGEVGLLSTLPVLCMSVFAPFAQRLSAARGHETAILFATIVIALSALVREWAGAWLMLLSAFTAGAGIAIAGTLLNTFVKQHFADRAITVSGLYSAALCLGAALAAGFTAPLTLWSGSWRFALAVWSIPGCIGACLWWLMLKRSPQHTAAQRNVTTVALPWTVGKAWLITLFFGLQSVTFYVVLAWLVPMYEELGWTASRAGAQLSYWIAAQVTFILLIARFARSSHDRRPWLIACGIAACIAMLGFAFAPLTAPWVWVLLLGFACGGWFPLAMTLPLDFSRTPSEAGSWTAMMLFGGYLISATTPSLAGWARDAGSSYAAIFAAMAVLSAGLAVLAIFLRPRSD
jgi:CP family cyanate transporter-like MFS transporter